MTNNERRRKLTREINDYIDTHKELQGDKVSAGAMDKACKELHIDRLTLMIVIRFGAII